MNTKKSLALAKNGYELLDRKRNILIREMMTLIDHANAIQEKIDNAYEEAYIALQTANVTNGFCDDLSNTIPEEDSLKLDSRSVMGVEIPILTIGEKKPQTYLHYGLRLTNSGIDKTYEKFTEARESTGARKNGWCAICPATGKLIDFLIPTKKLLRRWRSSTPA